MKSLVLAILTTGLLLEGTNKAVADCQTLAEAKASNPRSYLAYHVIAGARCWFPGNPRRQRPLGAKEPQPQSAALSDDGKADEPPPGQEQVELPPKTEMAAVLPDPSRTAGFRVADTFDVIGFDRNGADARQSFQALQRQTLQRQVLGTSAGGVLEHDPAQAVQLSWRPSASAASDAPHIAPVIRILLGIGIFIAIAIPTAGLLGCFGDWTRAGVARRTGSQRRDPGQGLARVLVGEPPSGFRRNTR